MILNTSTPLSKPLTITRALRAGTGRLAAGLVIAALGAVPASAVPVPKFLDTRDLETVSYTEITPIPHDLLAKAWAAFRAHAEHVKETRYLTIADLSRHSMEPRLFILDLETGTHEALLVAHGQGSDRNHDGYADVFSNELDSHMTSLGAYVTGTTYYGKHGLSLRLKGLEPTNDRAIERAIVIHGAPYVSPNREILGRSWGCPAIELGKVNDVLPRLAGGSFLYVTR